MFSYSFITYLSFMSLCLMLFICIFFHCIFLNLIIYLIYLFVYYHCCFGGYSAVLVCLVFSLILLTDSPYILFLIFFCFAELFSCVFICFIQLFFVFYCFFSYFLVLSQFRMEKKVGGAVRTLPRVIAWIEVMSGDKSDPLSKQGL